MKKLYYKKFKGLHIVCKGCNRTIEVTQTPYKGCVHPIEKQRYKAVIKINGVRKTKDLKSTSYDDAVSELISWKKDLENPVSIVINQKEEVKPSELLEDCIWMYSDYLENVDVAYHERKHRSSKHIKQTVKYILEFKQYLDSTNFNTAIKPITEISKIKFGDYYEAVGKKAKSAYTFNHKIKSVKGFFDFIVDEKNYKMEHPCRKVTLKHEESNPVSVSDNDFLKLLSVVSPEDSMQIVGKESKNRYRPWTVNSFKLSAFTGMRNEEVVSLKYSDIKLDENGELDYLEGVDLKFERKYNWDGSKPKKFVPIPITPELEQLLTELDYKSHIGKDLYLIDGDNKMNRGSLAKAMSHSFTFYRRKAGLPDTFSIRHLRKTFLTKLQTQTGLAASAGYQKTMSVIDKHYLDKIAISRHIKQQNFSIFGGKS